MFSFNAIKYFIMEALALGARIWFLTVLVTVFFIDAAAILSGETVKLGQALGFFFLGTIIGLLLTLPLLLPTVCLVGMMPRLPYSFISAATWLGSMLAILVTISIVGVVWIADGRFPDSDNDMISFIGAVLLSLLIVLRLSLPSLREFNNEVRAKRLQKKAMA